MLFNNRAEIMLAHARKFHANVNCFKKNLYMIERKQGKYQGRNKTSAYKDLVWTVATSSDTTLPIEGQTQLTLDMIQNNLLEMGSDKTRIVSAQVYIANMQHKSRMDQVWKKWVGDNSDHWPQRACVSVSLEGDVLIEVTVTAIRKELSS